MDEVVLVDDDDFLSTAKWAWDEFSIAAELSGFASLAAIYLGLLPLKPSDKVCAVICGAGHDGIC